MACSTDSFAEENEETLATLRVKHPPPHPDSSIPPLPDGPSNTLIVSEDDIAQAIAFFPNGSARGPDSLRPQHLKDLISLSAEEGGSTLLGALTSFANLVLTGKTPLSIRSDFFGATLIALEKKEDSVCPIAVGNTLHCLIAKAAGAKVRDGMVKLLSPRQLGYSIRGGAEVAVYSARTYLESMDHNHLMLKLGFKNTLNSLRRDGMLEAIHEVFSRALPLCALSVLLSVFPFLRWPFHSFG